MRQIGCRNENFEESLNEILQLISREWRMFLFFATTIKKVFFFILYKTWILLIFLVILRQIYYSPLHTYVYMHVL